MRLYGIANEVNDYIIITNISTSLEELQKRVGPEDIIYYADKTIDIDTTDVYNPEYYAEYYFKDILTAHGADEYYGDFFIDRKKFKYDWMPYEGTVEYFEPCFYMIEGEYFSEVGELPDEFYDEEGYRDCDKLKQIPYGNLLFIYKEGKLELGFKSR